MENRPSTIGFEDGTIDVDHLLVETQDGHDTVDSVVCFNEKNPETAMDMEAVSRSFGVTNTSIAHDGEDILDGNVLDSLHNEVEGGYFRLQNDFCSMGEEYLLGVEFDESISSLDYVSSECLQTSVSDSSVLASGSGIISPWKADLFRIMEVPDLLIEEKPVKLPASCTLRDIGRFHDISNCSFQDILSDENTSLPHSAETSCSPKSAKNDECGQTGQNGKTNRFQGQNALVTLSGSSQSDALPSQKRSRKPTQRYIDELTDPLSRFSKRRRTVSSIPKDKSVGLKDRKKCQVGSRAIRLPAEESSVKAIQVPFASLAHKECPKSPAYDMVHSSDSDRGNPMTKPRNNHFSPENQPKRDECIPAAHVMKRGDSVTASQKKKDEDDVTGAHLKKRDERSTACHLIKRRDSAPEISHKKKVENIAGIHSNKRDGLLTALSRKKRSSRAFGASPKKKNDCLTAVRRKKREEYLSAESSEEVSGRRKHHRLWTIAEVNKLIDGVSEYGVGRWSRIKKLFFSSSAHRTSVDLKDKWRNLLKASGMQGQRNQQGEKKRNLAWRPLPKSILRRVCELASMYPYPKGGEPKIAHIHHGVSPDRSTDITLSDYRRILRSINGN